MKRAGLALLLVAAPAAAEPEVDWARGLVIERAIGTADRRAPSPAVARVGAEREAAERATAALLATAAALPGVAAPVDGLAAATLTLEVEHLPDGSVRLRRGLPIEAIRQASAGPRVVTPVWDGVRSRAAPPAPFVVDARDLEVSPRVGIVVTDGTTTVAMPAIWVTRAPKGKAVKATRVDDAAGALVVGDLAGADPGALLVVVIREKA